MYFIHFKEIKATYRGGGGVGGGEISWRSMKGRVIS
jgi:hypothetical protein